MKRIALALLLSTVALPAIAADNLAVTPGAGATIRMRDTTGAGGPLSSYVILGDLTGVSILGTAGAANANVVTVQGIASGFALPVSGTVAISGTPTVRNTGNAGAVYDGVIGAATAPANMTVGGGVFNSSPITLTTGQSAALQFDANGFLKVNTAAGAAAGGTSSNFGSAFPTPGTAVGFTDGTNMVAGRVTTYGTAPTGFNALAVNAFVTNANPNGRAVSGSSSPTVSTPALTTFHLIAANTTNATSVKASAATLYSCQMSNNSTTAGYLKIYNKASAPTVGTDVPIKTLIIPGPAAGGGGSNIIFGSSGGLTLGTGFALAVTGVITDADTTAVAAATFAINCDYE